MRLFILLFLSVIIVTVAFRVFSHARNADDIIVKQIPNLEKQLNNKGFKLGNKIFIRIFKEEAELEMWVEKGSKYELFKIYKICNYGYEGLGPKLKEGDGKAPEGFYYVKKEQLNPHSSYHLAFNLGYPNKYDQAHGRTGSALMVHGNCVSVGCYAMTDDKIEEIYTLVHQALENGQSYFRVHIFPFKMSSVNMLRHKDNQWIQFWQNLKQGYDYFESNQIPPNVEVKNKVYVFD